MKVEAFKSQILQKQRLKVIQFINSFSHRAIEKDLKESLATLHLQETTSRQLKEIQRRENLESLEGVQKQNRRLHVELPFHSKFLLIAAYLASYNPAKSDKRFFVKHHGKQRKTKAGIAAKERAVSSQLTGPKASSYIIRLESTNRM